MVVAGPAPCSLALRWPSPRLKLGGASTVAPNNAGATGSDTTYEEFSCYLTARPGYRTKERLRSPTPTRPQRSARAAYDAARVPRAAAIQSEQRQQPVSHLSDASHGEAATSEDYGVKLPPLDSSQRTCTMGSSVEDERSLLMQSDPLCSKGGAFRGLASHAATAPVGRARSASPHELEFARASGGSPTRGRKNGSPSPDGATSPSLDVARRALEGGELDEILAFRQKKAAEADSRMMLNIPGNIENICRSSFQAASAKRGEMDAALAWRRREQYAQVRHLDRVKAKAWKRTCERRQQQDMIRIQRELEEQEAAQKRAKEISMRQDKAKVRELKLAGLKERLEKSDQDPSFRKKKSIHFKGRGSHKFAMNHEAELISSLQRVRSKGPSVFLMGNPGGTSSARPSGVATGSSLDLWRSSSPHDSQKPGSSRGSERRTSARPSMASSNIKERLSQALVGQRLTLKEVDAPQVAQLQLPPEKLELPPILPTADQRIAGLRRVHKLKAKADKRAQEEAARKAKYEEMSAKQRQAIEWAFGLFERMSENHQHSLGLDAEGLRHAVIELGLRGRCASEWRSIKQWCEVAAPRPKKDVEPERPKVGCDLYKFAVDVVSDVRKSLVDYRRSQFRRHLANLKTGWEDINICFDDALECISRCWPLSVEVEGSRADEELQEEIRRTLRSCIDDNTELSAFVQQVQTITEEHQHTCCRLQRDLQKQYNLDEETFHEYRSELISFHSLFVAMDHDETGNVSTRDMVYVFKELRLLGGVGEEGDGNEDGPGEESWQTRAIALISEAEPISFARFLHLSREISDLMENCQPLAFRRKATLQQAFERHCIDDELETEPVVSPAEVNEIFMEASVTGDAALTSKRSRSAVERVLEDTDIEGTGHVTFDEVRKKDKIARLQLRVQAVLAELELAKTYGFGFNEVRDMHQVFAKFDADGSGSLEPQEVQEAISLLKLELASTREQYWTVAFSILDEDGSGNLEFDEFMHLIQRVRDREGIFKSEDSPIANLKDLDRMDLLLVLDCFGIDAVDWEDEDVIKKVHLLLEIDDPLAPLLSLLNIETLADLFAHCRWKYEFITNEQRRSSSISQS